MRRHVLETKSVRFGAPTQPLQSTSLLPTQQGRSLSQRMPSVTSSRKGSKISSVNEILHLFWEQSPNLFSEGLPDTCGPPKNPLTPQAVQNIASKLNNYERSEILRKSSVYHIPETLTRPDLRDNSGSDLGIGAYKSNYGFDDPEGNYIVRRGDHIEYRYEISRVLGTGSFGNVVLCVDHKYSHPDRKRYVAVKIIKNELDWSLQAVSEIKMLKQLGIGRCEHLMRYLNHFNFRGHMCIVTEVLSVNLYTFMEVSQFSGVSLPLLWLFASQIGQGIQFIHDKNIIHCDIKPENIMIRLPTQSLPFCIKIIDFGSSCYLNETSFSYIQLRFYRAPEVILGAPYTTAIDIWSFGCVLAELFSGRPLIPGSNEIEQVSLMFELFGAPSSSQVLSDRAALMRTLKITDVKNLTDPLVCDPSSSLGPKRTIDEKEIRKTLLYSLFSVDGKLNLQSLNSQLQMRNKKGSGKKQVKLCSRLLEVALQIPYSEEVASNEAKFMQILKSIFVWNPKSRPSISDILSMLPVLNSSTISHAQSCAHSFPTYTSISSEW